MRVYTYVCIQARPISTNPGCMEKACEYGLTRGTCFVARHLEVVAVAGLLCTYSLVCFFSVWLHFVFVCSLSSNAHGLLQVRAVPCLMYLSTSRWYFEVVSFFEYASSGDVIARYYKRTIYSLVCLVSLHFVFFCSFSSNAHGLLQVRAVPCLMYLSTSRW